MICKGIDLWDGIATKKLPYVASQLGKGFLDIGEDKSCLVRVGFFLVFDSLCDFG